MPFERNESTLQGAMWCNEDGSFYVSIDVGMATYKFYANRNKYKKEGDKQPDYKLIPAKPKMRVSKDSENVPF